MFCRSFLQSCLQASSRKCLSNYAASSSIKRLSLHTFVVLKRNNCNSAHKEYLKEKYDAFMRDFKATTPINEVNPLGVFANNELDLSDIDVYGFDYDYTLAVYKESLHFLIYDLGRDWLVNKFKYPPGIRQLTYQPGFAIRGLHYDMHKGLLMKLDSFHQIQFESVYRGMTPISKEEVISIYGGSYIPQEMIRGSSPETTRMKQLNDLFSVPEICLISNVTEYFERNGIAYEPAILSYDIQNAVQNIHPVMHKMIDDTNIDDYLENHDDMSKFLYRLRDAGKKMFLITNSPFKFVDIGMKYMIGPNWRELFDVIVVQAAKPNFFTGETRPFRIYDVPTRSQLWERVQSLDKGKVYMEGNLKELQKMTGWYGSSVLYFGDQIYSDLADLTLHHGWRTGAIIYELKKEIETLNTEDFCRSVGWLQCLQKIIENMQYDNKEIELKLLEEFLVERDSLRIMTKSMFNEQFGSIFRTHHNPTYFSRRLFRYSDIYTSHVSNLLHYSLKHIYYPRRGLLPHESM